MAYGYTKKVVNAGGMTENQVKLILSMAEQKAWDQHPVQKMREFYAMHIGDIESNPATSPLTGGWHGTASKLIESLKKLPNRSEVEIAALHGATSGATIPADDESDPWSNEADNVKSVEPESKPVDRDPTQLVGPGVYSYNGAIFAVKESTKNPGRHYAHLITLVDGKYKHKYAPGVIFKLTEEMRVTGEQVLEMNRLTIREVNGKRVGSCCVCGRMLTKKASIDAGIGPICAGKVGL